MSFAPDTWIVPKRIVLTDGVRAAVLVDLAAGPCEVDVLVREQTPARLEIVGQITRAEDPYEPLGDLAVALVEPRGEAVGQARTDDFGEFRLNSQAAACFSVRLGDAPKAPCVLVWETQD